MRNGVQRKISQHGFFKPVHSGEPRPNLQKKIRLADVDPIIKIENKKAGSKTNVLDSVECVKIYQGDAFLPEVPEETMSLIPTTEGLAVLTGLKERVSTPILPSIEKAKESDGRFSDGLFGILFSAGLANSSRHQVRAVIGIGKKQNEDENAAQQGNKICNAFSYEGLNLEESTYFSNDDAEEISLWKLSNTTIKDAEHCEERIPLGETYLRGPQHGGSKDSLIFEEFVCE